MLISDILIFMVWTMDAIMGMAGGDPSVWLLPRRVEI